MKRPRPTWMVLSLTASLALWATACGNDDGPSAPEEIVGTIRGTVTIESTAASGVTVTLVGVGSRTTTTTGDGTYQFTDVRVGTYSVGLADIPADVEFQAAPQTAQLQTSGQIVTVDFDGVFLRTSRIEGTVAVSAPTLGSWGIAGPSSSAPAGLTGMDVTATGPETSSTTTESDGSFLLEDMRAGTYEVSIGGYPSVLYDFPTATQSVTVEVGSSAEADFQGVEMVIPSGFGAAPAIDGDLGPGEWESAVEVPVGIWLPSLNKVAGSLFIMNTGTDLYLAVSFPWEQQEGEGAYVTFDFNNDYDSPEIESAVAGDDVLISQTAEYSPGDPHPWFWDRHFTASGLRSSDATQDGSGATSTQDGQTILELTHPLDSGDDVEDFSLVPGDVVGFNFSTSIWFDESIIYSGLPSATRFLPLRINEGPPPDHTAGFGTPSAIDGVLETDEWEDATEVPLSIQIRDVGTVDGSLFLMNDGENLYLAVTYPWDVPAGDWSEFDIRFNNDNDSSDPDDTLVGDDALLSLTGEAFPGQAHYWFIDAYQTDPRAGASDPSQDGEGATSTAGGWVVHELSHPLNSGDDRDFSLKPGGHVGFYVYLATWVGGSGRYSFYPGPPSRYLTLKLAG